MGGGGGGVTVTAAEPDPAVTSEIDSLLNGARSSMLSDLEYNSVVGEVAQDHAQDMVDRDYLSISDPGTSCENGTRLCDMGDDLNDRNRRWDEIVQMVAEGDKTVTVVFNEFENRDINNNEGNGDLGDKLDFALQVEENYEFFALGKAGSGADTKWALIVVDPQDSWSER